MSAPERWASVSAGSVLAVWGISQLELGGGLLAGLGGYMLYRGFTGYCPIYQRLGISSRAPRPMQLEADVSATIERPPQEVYEWYRHLERLPLATKYVKVVNKGLDEQHWRWRVALPGGKSVHWETELEAERPLEEIRWHSVKGMEQTGEINFAPLLDGTKTDLQVRATWRPKIKVRGLMTRALEVIGTTAVNALVRGEVRRTKRYLETGETAESQAEAPVLEPVVESSPPGLTEATVP